MTIDSQAIDALTNSCPLITERFSEDVAEVFLKPFQPDLAVAALQYRVLNSIPSTAEVNYGQKGFKAFFNKYFRRCGGIRTE